MTQTLQEATDGVCRVLSEISSKPDFPEGDAALAACGLISAVAECWDELPDEYLMKMLPFLALLYVEVINEADHIKNIFEALKNGK